MELAWLQDFLSLAEAGCFSRAAEQRNMTQPAFSRRIKALEAWVDADLFYRDARPVMLTPAGEAFRPAAEETLRRLNAGREEARNEALASAGMRASLRPMHCR